MTGRREASEERNAGLSRRQLLRIGGLGAFGLSLARLFQAEAAAAGGSPSSASRLRHCILIYFYGGVSQLDTWDLKPNAPREVRGEFRPIATTTPGIAIGEHLPHCAQVMHKMAIVRSLHHGMRNHNSAAVEALCGHTPLLGDRELLGDSGNSFPCYGAVVSHQLPRLRQVPSHVALPHVMYNVVTLPGQSAGFLGAAYNPLQISHDPNDPRFRVDELTLPADLSLARLESRRSLLALLDRQKARAERSAAEKAMSVHQQRALGLLHSPPVRRAFDLSREPIRLRERYGRNRLGQSMLLARRLVEAGVRFVNVNDKVRNGQLANWDSHENNFARLKNDLLPPADQALTTLIEDLDARGLLESTLVVALAEFGRTPRINKNAGRDHWPDCFSIVLAGGGVQGGAVYGSSDGIGAYPASDPVSPADLAATLFWRFGLSSATEIQDLTGRPYRLAEGQPLRRLF
ncbi:MAG TPA: DUF1501 domain-containing protein [Gemmataceae bacterium]|nr:DUF1501 domain-containing protein [Gemmataceae bacterium]